MREPPSSNPSASPVTEEAPDPPRRGADPQALDAFICYSRRDTAFCRRLERALESFKPPRGVPGSGERLRVFRDEEDFVGPEYFSAIEGFLARSRKLVVVCSPSARSSTYTNDEIRRFVALHGPGHLVVVLVDGIPNNEAGPGDDDRMAFPEALCEAAEMPLAIDWSGFDLSSDRIDRGRFRGSWYTLLAGLLDVDRSVIEQRDRTRTRRRRRLLGWTTAAVMLALVGLSAWALTEQAAARVAEGEAEDSAAVARAQRDIAESQRLIALAAERAAEDSAAVAREQRSVAEARRREAEAQRREAEAQRLRAVSRLLSAQAADLAAGEPALLPRAMLLAVEALRIAPDDVAAGVIRAGLGTLSRLRASAPGPRSLDAWVGTYPCGGAGGGTRVEWERTDRAARVVRPDARVEVLVHDGPITLCAFLDDGSIATYSGGVEVGAGEPLDGDGTIRVWDPPPPLFALSPEASVDSRLVATAFSPTEPLVAVSALRSGGAEVFDLETGDRVATLAVGTGQTVSHLAFSADGRYLASAQVYGETFDVWAVDGFTKVASFVGSWGEGSVALSPTGSLLVGRRGELTGRGRGLVWSVAEGRALAFPPDGDTLLWRPGLTPDGRRLVTLDNRATLILWDVETRLPIDSVSGVPRTPTFGHGSAWFIRRREWESFAHRWQMAPGAAPVPLPSGYAGCLAFGPGTTAVRCSAKDPDDGGSLVVFDTSSGRTLRLLEGSGGMARVGISNDGRWVAGASYQYGGLAHTGLQAGHSVKVWDARSGAPVAALGARGLVAGLDFSGDGRFLASSVYLSEESGFAPAAVWVWRVQDLIDLACRTVLRNLTLEEWESYMGGMGEYRATCEELPPSGMSEGRGTVASLDPGAGRVTIADVSGSSIGHCESLTVTDGDTPLLVPDPPAGWRRGDLGELAVGDEVRVYVPRLGDDGCPQAGVPVAGITGPLRSSPDLLETDPSLSLAARALDAMMRTLAREAGDEAEMREPWDRISRAGVCEADAAGDFGTGLRTLYCSLRRAGFIDWFLADAPVPVFRGGPHDGADLDLWSDDFGRYDPEFVRWASERFLVGLEFPLVGAAAAMAYRPWAHLGVTYHWALTYLDEHPELDRALQEAVAAGRTDLSAALAEVSDAAHAAGLPGDRPGSAAVTAAAFWVRRGVDGSRPAFRDALTELLAVVDPDALTGG